jgi:glycosyltransferase involved in cell wall biosynthesis
MRILVVAPRLPWPPTDGGRIAMSRLAESLANGGAEVEILSLNPRKHRGVPAGPLPIRAIDINTSLPALFSGTPLVVSRFISRAFASVLRETLRRFAPDVVQIESPFLLPYVDAIRATSRARIALRSQNVEFRIWEGLAQIERNPLRRVALRRIAASLRAYELRAMQQLDAVLPISDADAADFRRLGITVPMHVVPCGARIASCDIAPEPGTVGFIGSLDFLPNQDAVRWILNELWPRVLSAAPDARLSIAGSSPPDWLRDRVLANVRDAAAFVCAQSVVIAPLFAGGGMRIKVLDSMALGKPIVATTIGAGGIDAEPGREIVIADDVVSFADAVVRLLRDGDTAARIGAAAKAKVRELYDNDGIGRGVLRFYEPLTRPSATLSPLPRGEGQR